MSVIKYVDLIDDIDIVEYDQINTKRAREAFKCGVRQSSVTLHGNCEEENKELMYETQTGIKAVVEYTPLSELYDCRYYALLIPVRSEDGKHEKLYYIVDSTQAKSRPDSHKFDVVPLHEVSKNVEVGELAESQVSDNDIPSEFLMFKI
jgi:hypothetical protein